MDSSNFLWKTEDGKNFLWKGDVQNLQTFFKVLGCKGIWTQIVGGGSTKSGERWYAHKFTNVNFVCTWFETTKTLQLQGKRESMIRQRLENVFVEPVQLKEESEAEESTNQSSVVPDEHEEYTDVELGDGLHPGDNIANLIGSRLQKWRKDNANITIVTPFLDDVGLQFIACHIKPETSVKIYTRQECGWDKKIDAVLARLAEADLSKSWIAGKIIPLKSKPSFHGKLLAGAYPSKVELIYTSCNMTKEHLVSKQLETVFQDECTLKKFEEIIQPLAKMAQNEFLKMADLSSSLPNNNK